MSEPTVTIDLAIDIYEHAKGHSTFEDTINTVLRRLLDLPERPDGDDEPTPASRAASMLDQDAVPARVRAAQRAVTRRRATRAKRTRAAAGTLLPESEYHRPILEILNEHGGRAPKNEVIEGVGTRLGSRLTEADQQPLDSGGIRWQSRAQFARLRLVDRGLMDREAPRGIWAITPDGIKALDEETV
jgi:Mrr N-terminal domain